jgi:hypothetical protein
MGVICCHIDIEVLRGLKKVFTLDVEGDSVIAGSFPSSFFFW